MKTPAAYFVTCDVFGCEANETYFPGEEEKLKHRNWIFIYPNEPKTEFNCKTLCPHHSHLESFFKAEIDDENSECQMDNMG